MANKSLVTYIPPKTRFVQVSNSVVEKYAPEVVGIYCKIVRISQGKSLTLDFIAKSIGIKENKVRRVIVFLEDEGYVVREHLRDNKGHYGAWNYKIYSEPVDENERSHAGRKGVSDIALPTEKPTSRETYMKENGKDNNISISNKDIPYSYKEKPYNNKQEKSTNVDTNVCDEFTLYMRQHYPYIMKMDKPLTQSQATKLKEEYGEETVLKIFDAMDNYKQLLKKYRDAYKTADNWCKREMPAPKPQQQPKED